MAKEVIHLPLKEIDPLCRRAVILFNLLGLKTNIVVLDTQIKNIQIVGILFLMNV